MNKQTIKNGHRVKDIVSGIVGIVKGKTKWLTGCDTVHIEPAPGADNKKSDLIPLDINSVEFVDEGVRAKFKQPKAIKADKPPKGMIKRTPGGPQPPIKHPNL